MAKHTIARMYDNYSDASTIVHELEAAGIPDRDISLIANADAHGRATTVGEDDRLVAADRGASAAGVGGATGAAVGGVIGGGAGLLAGIGALAIPGVGPVVAAGWLVATLAGAGVGAVTGGLAGSLAGAGVNRDEAQVYAEGVKRGGSLVTVRVEEADVQRAETIMAQRNSTDWQQRRSSFGPEWTGFDERSDARSGASTLEEPVSKTDRLLHG